MKHFLLKCSTLPCGKCVCLAGSSSCLCWCLCVWSSSHFSNKDMWEFRSKTSTARPQKCAQVVILFNTERREKHNEKHFGIRSVRAPVRYVRKEHLRLFLSFFLLLSPALEGESSLSLAWPDILEEFCWLKWLGTWRASPPWEAKLALQPPTTHCSREAETRKTYITHTMKDNETMKRRAGH